MYPILSIYIQLFYPVIYPSLYLFFIETYPAIDILTFIPPYPLISSYLSFHIRSCILSYPLISRFHIHSYSLLSIDIKDLVFGFFGLQRRPAGSGPSLACPAHQWDRPQCFVSLTPGAAKAVLLASSGPGSGPVLGPVAAVAQALVVCSAGARYRRRRRRRRRSSYGDAPQPMAMWRKGWMWLSNNQTWWGKQSEVQAEHQWIVQLSSRIFPAEELSTRFLWMAGPTANQSLAHLNWWCYANTSMIGKIYLCWQSWRNENDSYLTENISWSFN